MFMFINRGRIVSIAAGRIRVALSGTDGESRADRRGTALKPIHERSVGRSILLFDRVERQQLAALATCERRASPICLCRAQQSKRRGPRGTR